ncbi:ImmA/IrrE family metallo-endopeptidase [Corallococcus interemptor]|uniref:ImmA/IrrE family metallo-endopeptidase n=1 Tax=Corallococcus interemptor TaxID=2316720 RepID=A0A3A8QYB9_9BACT|nr:XRE family transcriptional regulator [Corallococcus interemptor]RKH69842.1 ImmA/IrrE family metallo-endopeptidase [Corallococcus interemptor]
MTQGPPTDDASDALRELGRRLSRRRKEAGLEVEALAARARVSAHLIRTFEQGEQALGLSALTRLASALGLSPTAFFHTSAPVEKALMEPTALLKGSTASASLSDVDRAFLVDGLRQARAFSLLGALRQVPRLAEQFQPEPPPSKNAHQAGYACARRVRALLPERQGPLRNLGRLMESHFDILVLRHAFTNPAVNGVSCRSGDARLIVIHEALTHEPVRRFVLAHELAHQLLDLSESDVQTDEGRLDSSRFWMENPPAEKRANAFAAMLLAPEEAVAQSLGAAKPEGYGLKAARELVIRARTHFGLSFSAMAWHLYNLRYIRERETVEALVMSPDETVLDSFEEDTRFTGIERRALDAHAHELISSSRARELLGRPVEDLLAT